MENEEVSAHDLRVAISHIADLLGHVVEGVARTGAFDQAGNGKVVEDAIERIGYSLQTLGYNRPSAGLRSAIERVRNVPHIKRLST